MDNSQPSSNGLGDVPLEPPTEGAIPVTPDGQVLKLVIEPGSGAKPSLHARCIGTSASFSASGTQQALRAASGVCNACRPCNLLRPNPPTHALHPPTHLPPPPRGPTTHCHTHAVHYVGRLLPSGDVFMDTQRDSQAGEAVKLVAGRSECIWV